MGHSPGTQGPFSCCWGPPDSKSLAAFPSSCLLPFPAHCTCAYAKGPPAHTRPPIREGPFLSLPHLDTGARAGAWKTPSLSVETPLLTPFLETLTPDQPPPSCSRIPLFLLRQLPVLAR